MHNISKSIDLVHLIVTYSIGVYFYSSSKALSSMIDVIPFPLSVLLLSILQSESLSLSLLVKLASTPKVVHPSCLAMVPIDPPRIFLQF